jgi:hypothetical protein
VHAKLNDLYAAVDDVTEAFKLQRKNATYKQHMGDLAQRLAQHVAVKCARSTASAADASFSDPLRVCVNVPRVNSGPRGAESPLSAEGAQLARDILAGSVPTT